MLEDFSLDKNTPVPLYYQLKTLILTQLKDEVYKPGDMIPTELELSTMFDISRTTVRQAITELVQEGYLYRIKSKGTFVSKPKETNDVMSSYYSYDVAVQSTYNQVIVQVLKKEIVPMPQAMIELGAGKSGDKAIYLYRRRIADGQPLNRTETYLPYSIFSHILDEDLENVSLKSLMNSNPKTRVCRVKRTIEALPPGKEDMKVLEMEEGSAIQKMTAIRYNEDGDVMDISYSYYRGDMNKIEVDVLYPKQDK